MTKGVGFTCLISILFSFYSCMHVPLLIPIYLFTKSILIPILIRYCKTILIPIAYCKTILIPMPIRYCKYVKFITPRKLSLFCTHIQQRTEKYPIFTLIFQVPTTYHITWFMQIQLNISKYATCTTRSPWES